jgi:hypothetical protein
MGALIEVDGLNAGYKGVSVVHPASNLTVNAGEIVASSGATAPARRRRCSPLPACCPPSPARCGCSAGP